MLRLLPALLLLAGCGPVTQSFNKGFEKGFQDSCRQAAAKGAAPSDVVNKYCDCAMKEYEKSHSMDQAEKACTPK
jgi:hypothetical protein